MAAVVFRIRNEQKGGMTLGDVAAFVENARAAGVDEACAVRSRTTVRGRLRMLEAEAVPRPDGGGHPSGYGSPGDGTMGMRRIFPEQPDTLV